MESLKQLLQTEKLSIPNLEDEVKALGYDPATLSETQAPEVFKKLKKSFSGKLAKGSKVSSEVAKQIATEIAATKTKQAVENFQSLANETADRNAQKIIGIIESIPDLTMERVKDLLGDSEGNLDFFRNPIEDVRSNFFAKFDID